MTASGPVERVVLVASLKLDARDRVVELLEQQAEEQPATDRQAVFLSETDIVFFFEGPDAEREVIEIFDDPVRSAAIGPWLPLFDGPLHRCYEALFFERT